MKVGLSAPDKRARENGECAHRGVRGGGGVLREVSDSARCYYFETFVIEKGGSVRRRPVCCGAAAAAADRPSVAGSASTHDTVVSTWL